MNVLTFPGAPPRVPRRAMLDALDQINAEFGDGAVVRLRKKRIRDYLFLGVGHPAVRARYGARAAMLQGCSLNDAIFWTERRYQDERKSFQIAATFGKVAYGRLSLEVLRELRLLLRFLRRSDQRSFLGAYIKFLIGNDHPQTIDVAANA